MSKGLHIYSYFYLPLFAFIIYGRPFFQSTSIKKQKLLTRTSASIDFNVSSPSKSPLFTICSLNVLLPSTEAGQSIRFSAELSLFFVSSRKSFLSASFLPEINFNMCIVWISDLLYHPFPFISSSSFVSLHSDITFEPSLFFARHKLASPCCTTARVYNFTYSITRERQRKLNIDRIL